MLPFKLVYSDAYYLPIGEHVFPAEKYRRIRDRLLAKGIADAKDFLETSACNRSGHSAGSQAGVCAQAEDGHTQPARRDGT